MSKNKNSLGALLRAAVVMILLVGVPVWLLMIVLITGSLWVGLALFAWVIFSYSISWRIEQWMK